MIADDVADYPYCPRCLASSASTRSSDERRDLKVLRDTMGSRNMLLAVSSIDGAGIGTFARGNFAKGFVLGVYTGTTPVTVEQISARTYVSDYAFSDAASGIAIDAADPQSCTARYTNDALCRRCNNAAFAIREGVVCLTTLRPISRGEEILVGYGRAYWRDLRWSLEILGRAKMYLGGDQHLWDEVIQAKKDREHAETALYISSQRPTPLSERELLDPYDMSTFDDIEWRLTYGSSALKTAFLNVGGALYDDCDCLRVLLLFFQASGIDVMFLVDARCTVTRGRFIAKRVHSEIPGAAVSIFPTSTVHGRAAKGRMATMGGAVAIISPQWARHLINTSTDNLGLGLINSLHFRVQSRDIHVFGVYIPPRASRNDESATLLTRIRHYMKGIKAKGHPRPYLELLYQRRLSAVGLDSLTISGGDFNAILDLGNNRDGALRNIVQSLRLCTPLTTDLLPQHSYDTFVRNGVGISRVDHIMHSPLPTDTHVGELGVLNHYLFECFDHRLIWMGLFLPGVRDETARIRYVNKPKRLNILHSDPKAVKAYQQETASALARLTHDGVTDLSPEEAGRLLACLSRASVSTVSTANGIAQAAKLHRKCQKRRSRYKDGYSPSMRVTQNAMLLYIRLRQRICQRRNWTEEGYYSVVLSHVSEWKRTSRIFLPDISDTHGYGLGVYDPSLLLGKTFSDIRLPWIASAIKGLRRQLHGRRRQQKRQMISDRVAKMETLRAQNKLGDLIAALGDKPRMTLDMSSVVDDNDRLVTHPFDVHETVVDNFARWFSTPDNLDPAAAALDREPHRWKQLMGQNIPAAIVKDNPPPLLATDSKIPIPLQERIRHVCQRKVSESVMADIQAAMEEPISLSDFRDMINRLKWGKAPGPSMLTTNMIKLWPPEVVEWAHRAMNIMWEARYSPDWWGDRVLCPAPKKPDSNALTNMRPIALYEILRKMWTGGIVAKIQTVWHRHNVLHPGQHGYRWRQGTDTALIRLINSMEDHEDSATEQYGTLWDIRRCFDSISKNLMKLAWSRLGVPDDTLEWFLDLDHQGLTFIWSPHMADNCEPRSEAAMRSKDGHFIHKSDLGFVAQRGCGQGDTLSAAVFTAVYDILLTLLDPDDQTSDIAYADDLTTMADTAAESQRRATLVSAFCAFTGLEMGPSKILALVIDPDPDSDNPTANPPLIVHDWQWNPIEITIQSDRSVVSYLGIDIPLRSSVEDDLQWCISYAKSALLAVNLRAANAGCKLAVIQHQILPKLLYKASKGSWSLHAYKRIDRIFSAAYRRALHLPFSFPTALLYLPKKYHGLGLPRFSDRAQLLKWGALQRTLAVGGPAAASADALIRRHAVTISDCEGQSWHRSEPSPDSPNFMRSLVAWASQVNLSLCCGTVQKDGPPLFSNLMSRLRAELRLSDLQEHDAPLQVCSDGSYEHAPSSINSLGETPRLTLHEGHGAAAIVWMGSSSNWKDIPPRILRIVKPSATDMTTAATMELTGLSTALCISQNQIPSCSPIISDCQGAIAKAKAAGSMSDHMVSPTDGGLLQHMLRTKIPHNQFQIEWQKSHPERRTSKRSEWTIQEWGIFLADAAAAADWRPFRDLFPSKGFVLSEITMDELLTCLQDSPVWQWRDTSSTAGAVLNDLTDYFTDLDLQTYVTDRDADRLKQLRPPYWNSTNVQLPSTASSLKTSTLRNVRRNTERTWDKSYNGRNRMKGTSYTDAEYESHGKCILCGRAGSQYHLIHLCPHPDIADFRRLHRRQAAIDLHYAHIAIEQSITQTDRSLAHKFTNAYYDHLFLPNTPNSERFWLGTINRSCISQITPVASERPICSHTLTSLQSIVATLVLTSCHAYERMEDRRRQEYVASISVASSSLLPHPLPSVQRIHRMSSFPITLTKRQHRPRRRTLPLVAPLRTRQSFITRFLPSAQSSSVPRRPSLRRAVPRPSVPIRSIIQPTLNTSLSSLHTINNTSPLLSARRRIRRSEKRKKRKRSHNRKLKRSLRERILRQGNRGHLATEPIDPGG